MIPFLCGLALGVVGGLMIAALCQIAREADERMETMRERTRTNYVTDTSRGGVGLIIVDGRTREQREIVS